MSKEINSTQDRQKLLLSIPEMAAWLGISRAGGYCLAHATDGPKMVRIGRRWLVPVAELERWINVKMQNDGGAYK
jgi:predicted DNA-binding transcriptional regulator AlpA